MKASLLAVLAVCVLAVTGVASANDAPNPAVAACKAEYQQLGPAGFAAKYGAGEAGGRACVAAHGGASTPTSPTRPQNGPEAACKAEYEQLGSAGFAAKYGAGEAGVRACLQAHGATVQQPRNQGQKRGPSGDPVAVGLAMAQCVAEAKSLGKDAFVAKYGGKESFGACVKAALAKARAVVAACKSSSGSNRDAFKQCLGAALNRRR